jgi:hypothetical protein
VSDALRGSPRVDPNTAARVKIAAAAAGYLRNPLAGALMSDPRICVPAKDLNETKLARQRKELLGDERSFKPTKATLVGDIGFGFMAVAPSATSAQTSEVACLAGELLACAMITWMRSLSSSMGRPATVDAVALYDCTVICEKAVLTPRGQQWSPGPNCSQDADLEALRKCKDGRPFCRGKPRHLPFSFVPPPWLAPHAVLHSGFSALRHCAQWPLCAAASETPRPRIFPRCFWGRIRTFHGQIKEGNYTTSDGR